MSYLKIKTSAANRSQAIDVNVDLEQERTKLMDIVRELEKKELYATAMENMQEGLVASAPTLTDDEGAAVTDEDTGELVPDLDAEVPLETRVMATTAATLADEAPEEVVGDLALPLDEEGVATTEGLETLTYAMALESLGERIKATAKAIWEYIKKLLEQATNFIKGFFNTMQNIEKRYNSIEEKFKDAGVTYELVFTKNNAVNRKGGIYNSISEMANEVSFSDGKVVEVMSTYNSGLNSAVEKIAQTIESATKDNFNSQAVQEQSDFMKLTSQSRWEAFVDISNSTILKKVFKSFAAQETKEAAPVSCRGTALVLNLKELKFNTAAISKADLGDDEKQTIESSGIMNAVKKARQTFADAQNLIKSDTLFKPEETKKKIDKLFAAMNKKAGELSEGEGGLNQELITAIRSNLTNGLNNIQKFNSAFVKMTIDNHGGFLDVLGSAKQASKS